MIEIDEAETAVPLGHALADKPLADACIRFIGGYGVDTLFIARQGERMGSGESFAAGLIFGLHTGRSDEDAQKFTVAASCLKPRILGDVNLATAAEV